MNNEQMQRRRTGLGRSPAYPAIGLEAAVNRVKQVRTALGNHPAYVDAIIEAWELSPRGSMARQTVAALRYFGLLEFEGTGNDRKGKVTQLALDILFTEDDTRERLVALQEAALNPAIHNTIWEEYGGELPESDRTLELELIRNRGFNDNSVGHFIRQFRDTLDFAGLTSDEPVTDKDEDFYTHESETRRSDYASIKTGTANEFVRTESVSGMRSIPLPVSTGEWPIIQVPYPMTEQTWGEMLTVLKVMKPGIVAAASKTDNTNEQPAGIHPEFDSEDRSI